MDALELALHCSGLMRPLPRSDLHDSASVETSVDSSLNLSRADAMLASNARMDETERERHFKLCGMFLYSADVFKYEDADETKMKMRVCHLNQTVFRNKKTIHRTDH